MTEIHTMTRFGGVDPSDVDEFRRLVGEGVGRVAGEPGTLQYEWFASGDGTSFVARETFADSDAVLAHAANVGDLVGRWSELSDSVDVEIFGAPSDDLRAALVAMAPTVYAPVTG
jgi:quinol monooxygenase YgiN